MKKYTLLYLIALLILPAQLAAAASAAAGNPAAAQAKPMPKPLLFTGVNMAGGDFSSPKPGVRSRYGTNYIYPSPTELSYFASKGMNIIRFPFHWEDLQPQLMQPLDPADLNRMKEVVADASKNGMTVILDPHNYARYYGQVIGGPVVSDTAFANFWGQMAAQFAGNPKVWFGLMNEPHDMPAEQWLEAANAAIAAIRKSGAKNLILVPGIGWTGAHNWISSGNGTAMLGVKDPDNHFIFEVHQYLDSNDSGTSPVVVSADIGRQRLEKFTVWCRQHHQRAFLGEFAAGDNPTGKLAIQNMLNYMEANRDVWVGFTWWAAGAWWGNYIFSLEPKSGVDAPLLAVLTPYLQPKAIRKTVIKPGPP